MENENGNDENISGTVDDKDLRIDFVTSSAISRINVKFLFVYIPILWFSGLLPVIFFYEWTKNIENLSGWTYTILFLPFAIVLIFLLFIFGCVFFSKLFLILINLIHKPREGIFKAEIGDPDFEFWCLRTELKKLVVWLMRACPVPWLDVLAFRWFGVKMDFSSHLNDAWVDIEFIKFGRKVMVGQGAVVMSSMVVGNYLIIKEIFFDDYVVVGGLTTIAPGTIVGKDSVIGAVTMTSYNQILESGWVYIGMPVYKHKPNIIKERYIIRKTDIAEETKSFVEKEVNIDEDKKDRA